MDTEKRNACFSIKEVEEWMETEVPDRWRQSCNVRVLGAGGDDGFNSPFVSPLIVPESIAILISPPGCGRHCSVGSVFLGDPERMFLIRIQQKDLVTGTYYQKLEKGITELVETLSPRPKAVFICGSCSDVLLASDYQSVGRRLEKELGVRVAVTGMEPILNDSRVNNIIKTQDAIYRVIHPLEEEETLREVNIIGRDNAPDADSDLRKILEKAGIERINHVSDFHTLCEYDRMSRACLNIAVETKMETAARNLQKRFGTPYVVICNTYDLEEIRNNYKKIGEALGVTLDDEEFYREAKQRIALLREKYGKLRIAVGEDYSYRPPKAAVELGKLGFSVKGLFVREVRKCDKEDIRWLSENCSDLKVYFTGLPGILKYINSPDPYHAVIGLSSQYYAKSPETIGVSVPERYFDYYSLLKFLDIFEETIRSPKPALSLGRKLSIAFGRGADIAPGCEKDFGMFKE